MKRICTTELGSPNSAFSTVLPPIERMLAPAEFRPSLRQHPRREQVHVLWPVVQSPANRSGEPHPLLAETCLSAPAEPDELASSTAETLRAMIRSGRGAQAAALLASPHAAEAAMAADAEGCNLLWHAIQCRDTPTACRLLELASASEQAMQGAGSKKMPLVSAAATGADEIVVRLLRLGSAREQVIRAISAGRSPLLIAASRGHSRTVAALLDSPDAVLLAASSSPGGYNAMAIAAYAGHADVVELLLRSRHHAMLALSRDDREQNALMIAAARGHATIVRHLLESPHGGALASSVDNIGQNALYIAVRQGHRNVLQVMLQSVHGLSPQVLRASPADLCALASARGYLQVANLLRRYGNSLAPPAGVPPEAASLFGHFQVRSGL